MKKTGKIMAFLLAACMVAPMSAVNMVSAADYTITINTSNTNSEIIHTYEAYQIFKGTLHNGILSNITWGSGVSDGDALLAALKENPINGLDFSASTTAADVAKVLSDANLGDDAAVTRSFADLISKHLSSTKLTSSDGSIVVAESEAGYYFIKDSSDLSGSNDAYTRFILKVAGNVDVTPKSSYPTVEKKVMEDDKFVDDNGYGAGYNDVADYCIGEAVPFKLIGTLPSTLDDYSAYYYKFTDTLGSQFNAPDTANISVYIDGVKVEPDENLRINVTGQVISVSFEDIKAAGAVSSSKITVEYLAVLNSTAAIGLPGQENKVKLTYSNNPNEAYNPVTDDSNEDMPNDSGDTPEDKVIVFTYELDSTKVDGTDSSIKLEGAEFKLLNSDKSKAAIIIDDKFTGWAADVDSGTTLTSAETTGLIKIAGLDDGVYYLRETKAPAGYNLLAEDIDVVISATTANGQEWSGTPTDALTALSLNGTAQADPNKGIAQLEIANNKGSTLPETGGIGTTIFYILGGTLVVGSGIVLINKKRLNKDED